MDKLHLHNKQDLVLYYTENLMSKPLGKHMLLEDLLLFCKSSLLYHNNSSFRHLLFLSMSLITFFFILIKILWKLVHEHVFAGVLQYNPAVELHA